MRKENSKIKTKFISEAGSYLVNADYFAFVELKDYACYVIADGIDPDEQKKSAQLAVTAAISKFSDMPGMSKGKLKEYIKEAHRVLLQEADEIRLEASILILVTDYRKVMWAHAGNCRLCLFHNGAISFATKDTSLTQRMADNEEISLDVISSHEERNNLYTYLGQSGKFAPVISSKHKIEDGDIIILQTRGSWENIGEAELIDATEGVSDAKDVCTGLEDVILSQRLEVIENYTIAAIFVDKIYKNPKAGKYKKYIKIGVALGMVVLSLVATLLISKYMKNKSNLEKMLDKKTEAMRYLDEAKYDKSMVLFSEAVDISKEIKVGKKNKINKEKECIQIYKMLNENMLDVMEAVEECEYKKANGYFESINEYVSSLEEEYGEEVKGYKKEIRAYEKYSSNMMKGESCLGEENYNEAIIAYSEAEKNMDSINDTYNRNVATEGINDSNAKLNIFLGQQEEEAGNKNSEDEQYYAAKNNYTAAYEYYKKAKEEYNSAIASEMMSTVSMLKENAESKYDELSEESKRKEAMDYEKQANEAASRGDSDEAKKLYEKAQEVYQDIGDYAMSSNLSDKIDNVEKNNSVASADEYIMNAMEYLAQGKYDDALSELEEAKKIYKDNGVNDEVRRIETIKDNIENYKEELAKKEEELTALKEQQTQPQTQQPQQEIKE